MSVELPEYFPEMNLIGNCRFRSSKYLGEEQLKKV